MKKQLIRAALTILLVACFAAHSGAVDKVWVGGGLTDNNWVQGDNWTPFGAPSFFGDTATIPDVGASPSPLIDASSSAWNPSAVLLTIENGGRLDIDDGGIFVAGLTSVSGTLDMRGNSAVTLLGGVAVNGNGSVIQDTNVVPTDLGISVTLAMGGLSLNQGSYTLNDGLLNLNGNDINAPFATGTFNFIDGILLDVGIFDVGDPAADASFDQTGGALVVSGAGSPGTMTVAGGSFDSTGTVVVDVQGYTAETEYDVLHVDGDVSLGTGAAVEAMIDGFQPVIGDLFDVIVAGQDRTITVNGKTIDPLNPDVNVVLSDLAVISHSEVFGGGFVAKLRMNGGRQVLTLMYVPEPSTMLLAGMGLIGVLALRRRRRLNKKVSAE